MEIEKAQRAEIVIEIDGAKMTFSPSAPQDLVYAANVIQVMASNAAALTPVHREAIITHIFSKLKSAEGVKSAGEELSVERLRVLAVTATAKSILPIVYKWALSVYEAEGLIAPASEAGEKKE